MPDPKETETTKTSTPSYIDKTTTLKDHSAESPKPASAIRKFKIRRSIDSPLDEHSYEIVDQDKIDDEHLETSMKNKQNPAVELTRIESPNPASAKSIDMDNGLDPMGIELISSSLDMQTSATEITEEEFIEANIEEEMEIIHTKDSDIATPSSPKSEAETIEPVVSQEEEEEEEEVEEVTIITITPPKISREMRNLKKKTHDSKVLTDFLNTSFDSPRIRNRKPKEATPTRTRDTEQSDANSTSTTTMTIMDKEVPLKGGDESDSTVILRDETVRKRRKSFSRSRSRAKSVSSRAKSVSSRPKSVSRLLSDEMALGSEKEDSRNDNNDTDDMADVSPFASKLLENRAANPPPKPGWDSFCFKCHSDSAVLSLACRKCKSSYHRHCARLLSPNTPLPKSPDDFLCIDCIEIDKAKQSPVNKYDHPKIDQHMLKEMLTTVLEKIRTYPDRDFFENDIQFRTTKESNQPLIVTHVSLKTIEERIMNNVYKVSESFLRDIKQLEHNWTVVDRNKIKSLKNILKYVCTEINEMEACVHCYSSSFVVSNWFTAPCKRPHLLIWAKLKGYPYWPAKVMSIASNKESADVRFFGAHDRAWVYTANCLVFCEKDPNKMGKTTTPNNKSISKTQKGIADAMKEKDEYIENVRERFGFRYAPFRENLDPDNFQKQLENQLPGLKKDYRDTIVDIDGSQKEKLTLKIVKTPDGTQTIEQKTPKVNERDRHPLYRVLSKNEDTVEGDQSRVKAIILKRNIQSESEKGKSKRSRGEDSASETSESNVSMQETGQAIVARRKSVKDIPKRKKSVKNVEKRSLTPDPSTVLALARKKAKVNEPDVENELLEELPPPKSLKKSRSKSFHKDSDDLSPAIVSNLPNIPPGTSEIHSLRESPTTTLSNFPRSKQRSRSFHRSRSSDKDLLKEGKNKRRLSANAAPRLSRDELPPLTQRSESRNSLLRKSLSQGRDTPVPSSSKSSRKSSEKRLSTNEFYDSNIIIKDEPLSDEEVVERRQRVTVSDIANLVNDSSSTGKRKTILISTSDNSNDSFNQGSRARKTFPNSVSRHLDSQQIRNSNAMVCIPQVFSPPHPASPNHSNQERSQLSILSYRSNHQLQMANGTRESPVNSEIAVSTPRSRRESTNPNIVNDSIQRPAQPQLPQQQVALLNETLPRLVPKPSGVFTSEGNTFQRESGSISALFSENAHRMTDYFKSLLIDTIGAISSGVPMAENVLLKLEIEKFKQQLQSLKVENQLKIDKLKKEHADEIKILKISFDDKIKSIAQHHEQEKVHMIAEIRQQCENEKQRAIEATKRETKRMTWCSNCTKEARFYCCWNTSYCGPACQKSHWNNHQKYCTNRNSNETTNAQNLSKQPNPDNTLNTQTPVAISVTNRQPMVRTMIQAIPKQSPQMVPSQSIPITNITVQQSPIQYENNVLSQQSAIITRDPQSGQKVIHTYLPPQHFNIYQQKVKTLPMATTISSDPTLQSSNLIVKTIQRTNSPQLTFISTSNAAPSIVSELLTTSGSFPTQPLTTTSTIANSVIPTVSSTVALLHNIPERTTITSISNAATTAAVAQQQGISPKM